MPRASPSAKRQPGAASQRNTQHENGLVGPSKRIAKQQHPKATPTPPADGLTRSPLSAGTDSAAPVVSDLSPHPQPPTAAAATCMVAIGSTKDSNTMAFTQQKHRGSDATAAPTGSRRTTGEGTPSGDEFSFGTAGSSSLPVTAGINTVPAGAPPPPPPSSAFFDDNHRRIDVNAAKNANVHRDTGPVDLVLTVLRSCPLYDTIAILIILMQLSPVALSSIYMLFTVLTFVPPVTTSSGLSITEIFEGSLGTPALSTLMCMDVGVLLVWLFLWGPLQLLILDFAQIVIALTLGGGGGGSSRQGSANNIFVCLGIVLFSHFGHVPSLQKLQHLGPFLTPDHSSASPGRQTAFQPAAKLFARRGGGASWVRNIFAVHILTQGVVRYIREWYLRREKRDSMVHSVADPEMGRGTFSSDMAIDSAFGIVESDSSSYANSSNNMHIVGGIGSPAAYANSTGNPGTVMGPASSVGSGSGPAISSGAAGTVSNAAVNNSSIVSSHVSSSGAIGMPPITGHVSTKKKKKQSALVRLRQPLWAALASTKIVMIKEYELSQAASESAGAEATDVDNLGNAPFYVQPGQIWICYVGHDEVCFSTSIFPDDYETTQCFPLPSSSYIDASKPFFVRINNATWQPARIMPVPDDENDDVSDPIKGSGSIMSIAGRRWTGDIYGLTPLSSYECEFVSTRTGAVLFSTSVRTAPAPSRSADVTVTKPAPPSQLRPHESPATTIKLSIATQEAKLNDEKSRLKTLRKDNNRRANALKKEIDRLSSSAQSAGGNDEKLKQKITQNTVQQKQAEQAIDNLDTELQEVSVVPEDLLSQHRKKKSEWDREKALFDGAIASFKSFKSSVDGEVRGLEEEQASLQAKRNKIAFRIAKADSDHARIMDANARGLDEAERRRQERANIEADIFRFRQSYTDSISAIQASNDERVNTINTMHETMRSFYSSFDSERPYEDRYASGPSSNGLASGTPSSTTPGPGPWSGHQVPPSSIYAPGSVWPTMAGTATTGPSIVPSSVAIASPFMTTAQAQVGSLPTLPKTRGRSSSMLSDVSGFTQSSNADDEGFIPVVTSTQGAPIFGASITSSAQVSLAATLRGPPVVSLGRIRGASMSCSGSGSSGSVRSGSGSPRSIHDSSSL